MNRATLLCGVALAAANCAGCVQLSFERDSRLEPMPKGALQALVPGASDLKSALERLGPPLLAWELPDQGSALAWGWYQSFGWKLRASDSNKSGVSVSFNYDAETARMRGAVLFFDRDWKLKALREGLLSDLRDTSRVRPDALDASGWTKIFLALVRGLHEHIFIHSNFHYSSLDAPLN